MRASVFKSLCLFVCLIPLGIGEGLANDCLKGKYKKEKTIKKEFDVNSDALLKVKNRYGNLHIESWDQNTVSIEVLIKASGDNEEKLEDRLNEIRVDFENSPSMVSAITRFGSRSDGGWKWGRGKRVHVQVNYTIRMPVKNSVALSNDYGNIYLDRVDGHAKIMCDYGKIEAGELRGRNNELRFDYSSKCSFGFVESAYIIADYSGFTIEKAGDLNIKADYTNSSIEEMKDLEYNSDYGSLEVESVGNVSGNGSYIGVKLGDVFGNVSVTSDYGSLKIDAMQPDAGNINVKSDYTGIKIGFEEGYHFDFDISTEYAGVSGKDDLEINISKERSGDRYYSGYHGKKGSGNSVTITSDYGGITFNKKD